MIIVASVIKRESAFGGTAIVGKADMEKATLALSTYYLSTNQRPTTVFVGCRLSDSAWCHQNWSVSETQCHEGECPWDRTHEVHETQRLKTQKCWIGRE